MKPGLLLGIGVAFLAGMATAIMTGNALMRMHQEGQAAADRAELLAPAKVAQDWLDNDDFLSKLNQANRHIAAAVEPSVVHLAVQTSVQPTIRGRQVRGYIPSTGSGWVYDTAGHIITNSHVVAGSGDEGVEMRIMVHFADGRAFPAKVVGSDEATDIAVLAVDPLAPLVPARRASDNPASQGDRVYAFGSPFGFRFSMSQGIISALSRSPEAESRNYTNYLQTDAAVNPGNSGGPLCDIRGRVVGMNVAIVTDGGGGGSRGVGFAIPLSTIEPIVDQLISHGQVARGYLGVVFAETDDQNTAALRARSFQGNGVLIGAVLVGTPAQSAGVLPGDVITGVNGQEVRGVAQFRTMVATKRPGDSIAIRMWRENQATETTLTLGDFDEADRLQEEANVALQAFGIEPSSTAPVYVFGVISGSRAQEMGFRRGDVITAIGPHPVREHKELMAALAFEKFQGGKPIEITAIRAGDERKLTIEVPMTK